MKQSIALVGATLALALAATACTYGETPRLWGALQPGAHEVGFRTIDMPPLLDRGEDAANRPFAHGMRVYLWYPAGAGDDGVRCSLSSYYRMQEETSPSDDELLSWLRDDAAAPSERVSDETLQTAMNEPLAAGLDAPVAEGVFPLALWSMRHAVPSAQCVMNEYLASHGVVVAFAWPLGPTPPMPWEDHPPADKQRAFESMMRVLSGALDLALADPSVDDDRVALLAWSYGGESATALQSRRTEIDLVICASGNALSGWVFDPAGLDRLAPSDVRAEYLYLTQHRGFRNGPESSWPPLFEQWPHARRFVRFNAIHHGNFNVHSGMLPGVLDYDPDTRWSVGGADAKLAYESVCRLALAAIRERFNEEPVSRIKTIIDALPDGFVDAVVD